jgi:hypothetical protein
MIKLQKCATSKEVLDLTEQAFKDLIEECAQVADDLKGTHEAAKDNEIYSWEARRHAMSGAIVAKIISKQIRALANPTPSDVQSS